MAGGLVSLMASVQSAPVTLTTSQGGADTSVRGGDLSNRNFGHLDILRVRNSSNLLNARKAYLRFDLSKLANPIKDATKATLTLTLGGAEGSSPADKTWTFQVFGLKDSAKNAEWPEPTTNWDNAPANDVQSPSALTDDAVSLGTFTLRGRGQDGKTITFSSPELLGFLQFVQTNKATLIITRQEAGDEAADNVVHIFASKESAKGGAPGLTLDFPG